MIREINENGMEQIYREHMVYDFPKEELKPTALIRKLMGEGRYRIFGSYEGERLEAYALLIHEKNSAVYLLDFFAVCRDGRGKGTGSRFLRELFTTLAPDFFVLEVEDLESAADENERITRSRRLDFYHRNGVRDTRLFTRQFGVNLVVMYLAKKDLGETADPVVYESLDAIYRFVFRENYENGAVTLTTKKSALDKQ